MKIIVPVVPVPEPDVPIRLRADGQGADLAGLRRVLNPFDEVALEEALRLRERGLASEVLAVSCGDAACLDVLRGALALGADRALHVATDAALHALDVAKLLAALVRREAARLVLCGKQAADSDAGETGPMLAALLDWGMAPCVSQLVLDAQTLHATSETESGPECIELTLPAVVSADLRLNTLRYVTLQNTLKARKKNIESTTPAVLDILLTVPAWQAVHWAEHAPQRRQRRVANVQELLACLRDEAEALR